MKYGYARVSTDDQNSALQLAALKKAGCKKVFTDDGRSGATTKRPSLLRCIKALRPGDTLTVWKLDRLARSLRDLIAIVEDLQKRGVQFRSLTEEINTATAGGKLTFHIFGALAEFERSLITERTKAGVAAAQKRGVKFGRKSKLTRQQITQAIKLIEQNESPEDVADSFHVGRSTLYRAIAEHKARETRAGGTTSLPRQQAKAVPLRSSRAVGLDHAPNRASGRVSARP